MKRLIGVDIDGSSYSFVPDSANSGTVTISGVGLRLEQILLITNTTRNEIIYNFADATKGAFAYSQIDETTSELTLVAETGTHDVSDRLQIYVDVDLPMEVEASPQGTLGMLLTRILAAMLAPLGYRKDLQRYQATTLIESGTVTTVSTVTTVTTCSTVTNAAQLGGLAAERLVLNQNYSAWASTHRARIT